MGTSYHRRPASKAETAVIFKGVYYSHTRPHPPLNFMAQKCELMYGTVVGETWDTWLASYSRSGTSEVHRQDPLRWGINHLQGLITEGRKCG